MELFSPKDPGPRPSIDVIGESFPPNGPKCGFPQMGVPPNGWLMVILENTIIKWKIWGYPGIPYFRTPPNEFMKMSP